MNNNNKLAKFFLLVASLLLIGGFVIFLLEKTSITNLYNKPAVANTDAAPKPVNSIDYNPTSPADQDEANILKEDLLARSNSPKTAPTKINISLSAASQDVAGGPLIIRAILNVTSGECKLVLNKNSTIKEYSASIENNGTYNSCKGFDIPVKELDNGKWQIKLTATSGQAYGEVSTEVDIKK
jgi:hypothetical protein